MWRRRVSTEKQLRDQAETDTASNVARLIRAARIESPKRNEIPVGRNVAVAAKQAAGALPEIGNDHNVGFVIAGAGFNPCLPLAHVVGSSQVCVSVTAPDLQSTEFVYQEEVNHTCNRVGAIHGRGAILQNVDVIDHREGNQVNVYSLAKPGGA